MQTLSQLIAQLQALEAQNKRVLINGMEEGVCELRVREVKLVWSHSYLNEVSAEQYQMALDIVKDTKAMLADSAGLIAVWNDTEENLKSYYVSYDEYIKSMELVISDNQKLIEQYEKTETTFIFECGESADNQGQI